MDRIKDILEWFNYHNKNLTKEQEHKLDEIKDALDKLSITTTKHIRQALTVDGRLEIAIDRCVDDGYNISLYRAMPDGDLPDDYDYDADFIDSMDVFPSQLKRDDNQKDEQ